MKRMSAWLLAFLAAATSAAQAFQFDVWRSGMKVDKVVEVGKENGVEVEPEGSGLPFFGKKDAEDLPVRVEYRAAMKLMGYSAKVLFSFAPESKVLHTVRVEISVPMSGDKADVDVLAAAIAKQLDAKYKGQGDVAPEGLLGQLAAKFREGKGRSWRGVGDAVTMESAWKLLGGEVIVTYVDEKLADRATVEDRRIREKRLDRSAGGDKSKF
ncbi:MAG: hypothetical protein HZB55_04985 [Deltaproteobacteria bacterium]|nr:hypothetical protein [Deltaproteobacteria bacterium]